MHPQTATGASPSTLTAPVNGEHQGGSLHRSAAPPASPSSLTSPGEEGGRGPRARPDGVTAYLADIEVSAAGTGHIKVGDMDLSSLTRGFALHAGVGEVTRLSLDLNLFHGAIVAAGAVIEVGAETAALLVELGWTPPPASVPPPG